MTMRHNHSAPTSAGPRATDQTERITTAPPQPWWSHRVVWLLAQFGLPRGIGIGMRLHPDTRQPTAATLSALDGSWTTVELDERDGTRLVTEAGPTPLWAEVEHAYDQWITLGEPEWPRFGVTATHDRQWIWLDDPTGPHTWNITPAD